MKCDQDDTATINMRFAEGSTGTIHYFSNGSRSVVKEKIEIYTQGKILQLNNFKTLKGFGFKNFKRMYLWRQDKGQKNCVSSFINAVRTGGKSPIDIDDIFEVSKVSIDLVSS